MNKFFKSVYNKRTRQYIAVSELARGKTKSSSLVVKSIALTIGALGFSLSGVATADTGFTVTGGNTVSIADGTVYDVGPTPTSSTILYAYGGNIVGGDDVTIKSSTSATPLRILNNSTVSFGDNLSIEMNGTGTTSSTMLTGLYFTNSSHVEIGDNFRLSSIEGTRTTGITTAAAGTGSSLTIGDNAWIEGGNGSLSIQGAVADTGYNSVNIGKNATLIGRITAAYNSDIVIGTGSTIILDHNILNAAADTYSIPTGAISLSGQGASLQLTDTTIVYDADSYAGLIPTLDPLAVIHFANNSYGPVLNSSLTSTPYTQKLSIDGANVIIGASDGSSLSSGDFIFLNNSNYYASTTPDQGHALIELKDINVQSAGGRLIYIENERDGGSGSGNKLTVVLDNVDGSSQTDGIYLNGTGTNHPEINITLTNDTKTTGGLTSDGGSYISLDVDSSSVMNGDINNNADGNITADVSNGGVINGNVNNNGSGQIDLNINNGGTLNGNISNNGTGDLNLNVSEGGKWSGTGKDIGLWVKSNSTYQMTNESSSFIWVKMDGNSTLDFGTPGRGLSRSSNDYTSFKTLLSTGDMTVTSGTGNINISTNLGIGKGDLISVDGAITGDYLVNVVNYGTSPSAANESLRIIQGGAGTDANVSLTGNQYRDAGMYRYYLTKDSSGTGYWLVNGDGSGASHGGGDDDTTKSGNAYNPDGSINGFVPSAGFTPRKNVSDLALTMQGSAAAQTINLIGMSRNVESHTSQLRMNPMSNVHDTNLWINNFYTNTHVNSDIMGDKYKINSNTAYIGFDKYWDLGNNNTFISGVFGGMGRADNKYKLNGSNGNADTYTAGVYGMYLHNSGMFTDMSLQGYKIDADNKSYTEQGTQTSYHLKTNAVSVGLRVGQRFEMKDNFYVEPSFKLSYMRNGNDSFRTDGASQIEVKVDSADVFQYGVGVNLGKTINTGASDSFVQLYASLNIVGQHVSGGDVKSSGAIMSSDLDGYQLNTNVGANWQINKNNSVFTEINAGAGNKFKNTVGLGLGYRYMY